MGVPVDGVIIFFDLDLLSIFAANVENVDFFIYFGRLLALALMRQVQGGLMLEPIVIKMLEDKKISLKVL